MHVTGKQYCQSLVVGADRGGLLSCKNCAQSGLIQGCSHGIINFPSGRMQDLRMDLMDGLAPRLPCIVRCAACHPSTLFWITADMNISTIDHTVSILQCPHRTTP